MIPKVTHCLKDSGKAILNCFRLDSHLKMDFEMAIHSHFHLEIPKNSEIARVIQKNFLMVTRLKIH
jgi:hypothetical protein